jgi:hypothetical protein
LEGKGRIIEEDEDEEEEREKKFRLSGGRDKVEKRRGESYWGVAGFGWWWDGRNRLGGVAAVTGLCRLVLEVVTRGTKASQCPKTRYWVESFAVTVGQSEARQVLMFTTCLAISERYFFLLRRQLRVSKVTQGPIFTRYRVQYTDSPCSV